MLPFLGRIVVVGATPVCVLSLVAVAPSIPSDPCGVLTRTEVQRLVLGRRIARVQRRANPSNGAVECTWATDYFQTPTLRRDRAAFSLQLTVQPASTAGAALDELRTRLRNPANETTETIPGLGDEAFSNGGDAIVVSGAVALQVIVSNYDSSARPYPPVDEIARRSAALALGHLRRSPPRRGA